MRRLFLQLTIPPLIVLVAIMLLIHAQPHDDGDVRALLIPESDANTSFMGIRPGVTTGVDAMDILKKHPWVQNFQILYEPSGTLPYVITWTWNGQQPGIFRQNSQPEIVLTYDSIQRVESILVDTTIPLGYAYLTLGDTRYTDFGRSTTVRDSASFSALFFETDLLVRTTLSCPVTTTAFWDAAMTVEFSSTLSQVRRFRGIQFC